MGRAPSWALWCLVLYKGWGSALCQDSRMLSTAGLEASSHPESTQSLAALSLVVQSPYLQEGRQGCL